MKQGKKNMNKIILSVLVILLAYLIGSFPPSYIMGRLRKGIDLRQVGSQNLGAMNVFYKVGFWEGLLVLGLDIGKGALAVALARAFGAPLITELLSGVAVVLGHGFTIFLGFRGGKGGATSIGVLVFLLPWGVPFYTALFGLMLLLTHFPTLSYSVAFLAFILTAWLIYHSGVLLAFSIGLLLIPGLRYIPRIKEMYRKGGSWGRVLFRKDIKDRF